MPRYYEYAGEAHKRYPAHAGRNAITLPSVKARMTSNGLSGVPGTGVMALGIAVCFWSGAAMTVFGLIAGRNQTAKRGAMLGGGAFVAGRVLSHLNKGDISKKTWLMP